MARLRDIRDAVYSKPPSVAADAPDLRSRRFEPHAAEAMCDEHGHLERLLVVETWIDLAEVGAMEVGFTEAGGAADALRDVLSRHLEVNPAEPRPHPSVDVERLLEFAEDVVESARLDPRDRGLGVPVHRVGTPEHVPVFAAHHL